MGNCQRKDQQQTVTNFDNDKWTMKPSNINSHCFLLKNNYHPNVKLLKWISSSKKQNRIAKWRQQKKCQYLVNIYEKGDSRVLQHELKQQNRNNQLQKRLYIVTQELIRLKDFKFTQEEAVLIAYKCLLAYQQIRKQFGGFIAKQNMIYINRQGIVKVWIHQNLANNSLQFPHPAIPQQQFIQSLLHQIFTLSRSKSRGYNKSESSSIYQHIKTSVMKFSQMKRKLFSYIQHNNLNNLVCIQKQTFDKILDSYQTKQSKNKKLVKKEKNKQQEQSSLNRLKFIVGGDPKQSSHQYVKDYSQKNMNDNFSRDNLPMNQSYSYQLPIMDHYEQVVLYPMHSSTLIMNDNFI